MTDRKEALTDLLEKVEAGECRKEDIACAAFDVQPTLTPWRGVCGEAYTGSIDAAKALHEAVLSGWGWHVRQDKDGAYGHVLHPSYAVSPGGAINDNNPSRAWLIAIIKALIADHDQ